MKINKIPVEALSTPEGTDWINKYVRGLRDLLIKDPLRYRAFGPYWWCLKKAMVDRGITAFGDHIDKEWFDQLNYGSEELNLAAASMYEEMRIDGKLNLYDEKHMLEDEEGEPFEYVCEDSDVERLSLTYSHG